MIEKLLSLFSFKILNFIFVIGVFVYLIKTRLIPVLNKALLDKKNDLTSLKDATKQAQKEQQEVTNYRADQKAAALDLLDKIKQWNAVIEEENAEQDVQEKEAHSRLKSFVGQQQHALLMEHLKKEMVPCIMKDATESLETYFGKKVPREEFLERALNAMEEQRS